MCDVKWMAHRVAVMAAEQHIDILDVTFAKLEPEQALSEIERLMDSAAPSFVVHANAHTLNLAAADSSFKEVLGRADLILNDGKGVMLASRLLGDMFPADLNGNFFSPLLLQRAAERGWSVFFFGARPGVVERGAEAITARFPGLNVAGVQHGYLAPGEEDGLNARIRASGADVVLVGLGNPLQERWLDRNLEHTGARLGIGVGAFFDFQAGKMRRAPPWMNRVGLEWLYRLCREPRRMWKRYVLGNPLFLMRLLRSRW